jgi:Flp pilus assembly pilin Flp
VSKFTHFLVRLSNGEQGQTLVEYGLILAHIGIAAIAGLTVMGGQVDGLYGVIEAVADALSG